MGKLQEIRMLTKFRGKVDGCEARINMPQQGDRK
jgi:hypothetical protein